MLCVISDVSLPRESGSSDTLLLLLLFRSLFTSAMLETGALMFLVTELPGSCNEIC